MCARPGREVSWTLRTSAPAYIRCPAVARDAGCQVGYLPGLALGGSRPELTVEITAEPSVLTGFGRGGPLLVLSGLRAHDWITPPSPGSSSNGPVARLLLRF